MCDRMRDRRILVLGFVAGHRADVFALMIYVHFAGGGIGKNIPVVRRRWIGRLDPCDWRRLWRRWRFRSARRERNRARKYNRCGSQAFEWIHRETKFRMQATTP